MGMKPEEKRMIELERPAIRHYVGKEIASATEFIVDSDHRQIRDRRRPSMIHGRVEPPGRDAGRKTIAMAF